MPSKLLCSLAEPIEIFGRIKYLLSLGYFLTKVFKIQSNIYLSVPDGRCSPCCSTDENGRISILFLPNLLISADVKSDQNFDSISDI